MTSSNPGTLYINGTVFIDGNLTFRSSDYAVYQGTGTIYVNGTVTWQWREDLCQGDLRQPVPRQLQQHENALEIVADQLEQCVYDRLDHVGFRHLRGHRVRERCLQRGNGSKMNGPIIADSAINVREQ